MQILTPEKKQEILNLFDGGYLKATKNRFKWLKSLGFEFSGNPKYKSCESRVIELEENKTSLYMGWMRFSRGKKIKIKHIQKIVLQDHIIRLNKFFLVEEYISKLGLEFEGGEPLDFVNLETLISAYVRFSKNNKIQVIGGARETITLKNLEMILTFT